MPFILGLIALAGAAYVFILRARNAADMTHEIAGVASDVIAAARRFGFRRKLNTHAVDCLEEPEIAIAAAALAFLEQSGLPSTQQQDALIVSLQSHLAMSHDKAQEALILGRWLVTESAGPISGFTRLTKRLYKLQGAASFDPLMAVLNDVGKSARSGLTDKQKDALDDLIRLYRIT
jgi:uncharacterized membrane protein